MRSILAASLLVGGILAGCASSEHPDRSTTRDRMDPPIVMDNRDSWNRLHSDPVCGMPVNPKEAEKEYYQGSVYYFDSEGCRRRFHDNPTAYFPHPELRIQEVR